MRASHLLTAGLVLMVSSMHLQTQAAASVQLQCELFTSGETTLLVTDPTEDMYGVVPLDLERFRFKALAFGDQAQLQYIKLQVYYRSGPQAIMLHQIKLLPPFQLNQVLAGYNRVYSPDLGHELAYQCSLRDRP
jgi:hypothetical protein